MLSFHQMKFTVNVVSFKEQNLISLELCKQRLESSIVDDFFPVLIDRSHFACEISLRSKLNFRNPIFMKEFISHLYDIWRCD